MVLQTSSSLMRSGSIKSTTSPPPPAIPEEEGTSLPIDLRLKYQSFYNFYILEGSVNEVNISYAVRKKLHDKAESGEWESGDLEEAKDEVVMGMFFNVYPRWVEARHAEAKSQWRRKGKKNAVNSTVQISVEVVLLLSFYAADVPRGKDLVVSSSTLDRRDLLSCMLVSREWYRPSLAAFWRCVTIDTNIGGAKIEAQSLADDTSSLCPPTFWERLANFQKTSCYNHFTRSLLVKLSFRLALSVQSGPSSHYDLDEDDFDETVRQAVWREFQERSSAIAQAMALFPSLRNVSIIVDAHCDNDALDSMSLWSSLRHLTRAIQELEYPVHFAFTLKDEIILKNPRYLSPIITDGGKFLRSIAIMNASSWSLSCIGGLINAVPQLEHFRLARSSAFSDGEIGDLQQRHGPHLKSLELLQIKNLADEAFVTALGGFPALTTLKLTASVRLWDREHSPCYEFQTMLSLQELDVEKCSRIPPAFFTSVARSCPRLRLLRAGETMITDENFQELIQGCAQLRECHLQHCERISIRSLRLCMSYRHKHLRTIDMLGCRSVAADDETPSIICALAATPRCNLVFVSVGPVYETNARMHEWLDIAARFGQSGFSRHLHLDLRYPQGLNEGASAFR
ncbi:hypothetical protein HDU67_000303 [Dinochytrium kinnereticum]|nr:hypothetical protein HDU67_000303 [Dinochytrium kinnereticum]